MLKTLRYLFIITLSVLSLSCKKEAQTTATLKEELVDKWYYTSIYQKDYDKNNNLTKRTQLAVRVNTDYINFKADESFTSVLRTEIAPNTFELITTNGTFKVTTLTRFTIKPTGTNVDLNCNLRSLNSDELIFNQDAAPRVTGQPYTVIEHWLHR